MEHPIDGIPDECFNTVGADSRVAGPHDPRTVERSSKCDAVVDAAWQMSQRIGPSRVGESKRFARRWLCPSSHNDRAIAGNGMSNAFSSSKPANYGLTTGCPA